MRIIAGEFRSRRLLAPPGFSTRPMPDRVRESVFSMLGQRIKDATVLDAFAGSGSIGLEALSRGAKRVILVDQDRRAADCIRANIAAFRCATRAELIVGDALGAALPARCPRPLDLIFLDPPYPLVRQPAGWARVAEQAARLGELLAPDGFLILRTPWPFVFQQPDQPNLDDEDDEHDADPRADRAARRRGSPDLRDRRDRGPDHRDDRRDHRHRDDHPAPDDDRNQWVYRIDRDGPHALPKRGTGVKRLGPSTPPPSAPQPNETPANSPPNSSPGSPASPTQRPSPTRDDDAFLDALLRRAAAVPPDDAHLDPADRDHDLDHDAGRHNDEADDTDDTDPNDIDSISEDDILFSGDALDPAANMDPDHSTTDTANENNDEDQNTDPDITIRVSDQRDPASAHGPAGSAAHAHLSPRAADRAFGDLTLRGMKGPETHPYGKTAVHWYMRQPS